MISKPASQGGFTLVELMIALVLGLLVVAAAGGMFLSNNRVYGSAESLNRIQENSRTSFELMSRDIREAGSTPCGLVNRSVNMLETGASAFWTGFPGGVMGINGAGAASDSLELYVGSPTGIEVAEHRTPSSVLDVNTNAGLSENDVLIVCNADVAIIFVATGLPADKIQHNGGNGGNYCQEFQYYDPASCTGASGSYGVCFVRPPNKVWGPGCSKRGESRTFVARATALRWTVEDNGRGGKSLYRTPLLPQASGALNGTRTEIADGITDMQVKYRRSDAAGFEDASAGWTVADWKKVVSVQVELKIAVQPGGAQSAVDTKGVDGNALTRSIVTTTAIRNREGVL